MTSDDSRSLYCTNANCNYDVYFEDLTTPITQDHTKRGIAFNITPGTAVEWKEGYVLDKQGIDELKQAFDLIITETEKRVRQQYHQELSALIEGERRTDETQMSHDHICDEALDRIKALSEGMVGKKDV